ncbi:UNVERIFIED_CONTAM: hypothetical protein Sradi_3517200 [Sesamum radiatum]|uniref:Interferon-related developmental regulator N-terminal domain-containing protein n=1 Tax=Sesamum radiatum TaxID=300843 RepID=A0AAW2QFA0_SESRA
MGRRSSQKKSAAMLDSDDADSVSSSSSSIRLDNMIVPGIEEVQVDKDVLLDQCLDALYEKRGSTREKALASIIEAFNNSLQHEFVEKKFATLLHQCLNSIKKGSAKEVALASHAIGLLAITTGPGEKAQEILEECVSPISEALKTRPESSKISALLECLAVITFVGGEEPEQTEKSMQILWQMAHPKLGSNVAAAKPSPTVITMVVSAWSFLLTTMDGWALNPKSWQDWWIADLYKCEHQDGYTPEISMKIGGESLSTSTWAQLIQLNFLKHFLGGGFVKHMQDNQFLHDVFAFTPKKKFLGAEYRMSGGEKIESDL